jgi:hypothetical protein
MNRILFNAKNKSLSLDSAVSSVSSFNAVVSAGKVQAADGNKIVGNASIRGDEKDPYLELV